MEHGITDRAVYLERMAKPLQTKLRVAQYIDPKASRILDVGCADGAVTLALAATFPEKQFLGIDLDGGFITLASQKARELGLTNVRFEKSYLRELLPKEERFDSVLFISVLHEFFTYGEGISSVLKALADAEELLNPGGDIIIRDMIPFEYTKHTGYLVQGIREKIAAKDGLSVRLLEMEKYFGPLENIHTLNHFLLKYMYDENWDREGPENYLAVTFEEYERIFSLLGMELVLRDSSLLEYLRQKWVSDFSFSEEELAPLISTGFLVARKLEVV